MINGVLRPWGRPSWLFTMPTLRDKEWLLIGAISAQERCLAALHHGGRSFNLKHAAFLQINDRPSHFFAVSQKKTAENRAELERRIPEGLREVHEFGIMDPVKRLKTLVAGWVASGKAKNVILDVSSLPERFLFPLTRWLLASNEVETIAVTYMLPQKYTNEDLAYDANEASHLPTFVHDSGDPDPNVRNVIVGVGFLPFSLPEWLKKTYQDSNIKVSLILPFPSNPSNVQKGWDFVRRIESNVALNTDRQIARVAANDLSGCFDRIAAITSQGKVPSVFAPFGPKAHSVAMCLQAVRMSSEAYFTQPSYYHPDYSTGICLKDGEPLGYAYAIRVNGNDLYQ